MSMLQNSSVGGPAEKGARSQTKVRVPGAQSALKRLVKTSLDEQKSLLRTMIEATIMKVWRQVELGCHFATSTAWAAVARKAANP